MRQKFAADPLNRDIVTSLSHVRGRRSMRKPCGELVVTSIVARPLAALALAGAVAAPALSLPAAAQDRMTSETAPRLEAQRDQVAAFDIPAQALAQALTAALVLPAAAAGSNATCRPD